MSRTPDKPFLLVNGEFEPFFEYRQPKKLNKCKYELVSMGCARFSLITERLNREDVLKRIIKLAKGMAVQRVADTLMQPHYKILLTEDGITEVLICSRTHSKFIKFLMK